MSIDLNNQTLLSFRENIAIPQYDRRAITPGIVHIGVGNFHRAHQGVYLDDMFNRGHDHDWGIIGAGIKPYDQVMRQKLAKQDWLTTVVELDPNGYSARICGAMIDFAPIEANAIIECLLEEQIRIVSLTITEGGYYLNAVDGGLDLNNEDIIHDINQPQSPRSVFGILIAALVKRRKMGSAPFTVLSCDNIPQNGSVTRKIMLGLATAIDPQIAHWIDHEVAFPSSMVDCITPVTTSQEITMVAEKFGINDASPVICEPFRQWILEDKFPYGRPALEKVGVTFINDVAPYELMKLRILNGSHAAIAYPAMLMGIEDVHVAVANPIIKNYLTKLQSEEIIPSVPLIEGIDFQVYFSQVIERFSNPTIGDKIARLCVDGSNRQPKFILPTLNERLKNNQPIDGLALELALWCRYCAGKDELGNQIKIDDINAKILQKSALLAKDDPSQFLMIREVFGGLANDLEFVAQFSTTLNSLWSHGTAVTLIAYAS